jgi:tetratricopeptide (TPR) repeat protein
VIARLAASAAALALLSAFALSVRAADFSATLDAKWDFADPAASEARFRTERARWPAGSREALETDTQIARTQGLRRRFDDAHATLDAVAKALPAAGPRVDVRYLLERGRTFNSAGDKTRAFALFREAATRAAADPTEGAAFYHVDALHMLGIAAPPAEQLDWNLKALAAAEAATDPRARGWRGSLLHNIGWTWFDRGDTARAIGYWQQALAAREAAGDGPRTRVARWTLARGYRAAGRLDDAETIQRALAAELDRAGAPDGFVFEELAEIALARGDATAAQPWAAKAHALLKDDEGLRASDAARLARLAQVAGVADVAAGAAPVTPKGAR